MNKVTNALTNAFTLWMSLLVEAIPFLLLGVLLSSLLLLFVNERKLISLLPRNPILGALVGSSIGFLFPVCECGNVPVARRLLMQGVPPSVAIGFLLAAPTVNPIVIWSTWTAFRDLPEIVLLRIVFSLGIATIVGSIFSVQKDLRPMLQPTLVRAMPRPQPNPKEKLSGTAQPISPLLQSGTFLLGQSSEPVRIDSGLSNSPYGLGNKAIAGSRGQLGLGRGNPFAKKSVLEKCRLLADNMIFELQELGGVLVVGSAIAAVIQVAAPRELILSIGAGPVSSILAMLVLATVVSICSTVDAFFALSFASAFTSGSLLAFLVFGPMIDLKALGLMLWIFKGRAIVYITILPALLTFFLTLAYNLKLG
ncbi:MAG: permease [Oscillatoria sp. SIO1A7]|nr:permease [Oscillatoria sp. SIO1A7]